MADEDERPEEETVPFTKVDNARAAVDAGDAEKTSDPNKTPTVKQGSGGPASRAQVSAGKDMYSSPQEFKPEKTNATANAEGLRQNLGTDNGRTSPGSRPTNNETIRVVNGVYMHRHPGYPAGASSLSQQRWHPAKQRHRSESGRDITEKLHEAAGLGPDGLRGAPPMTLSDAWQGTKASMKRNSGMILGSMALAGISAAPKVVDSLFSMAEAIMSGNPMSMASTIASSTVDVFSSIPQEMARLREKYNIPEGVPEETLMSTLIGGLYKREADAYDEAYTRESKASNAMLASAVDSGVIVDPTSNRTLEQMYRGTLITSDPVKDWDTYNRQVQTAKRQFLSLHPTFDWDSAHKKALTEMSDTQLRMMAEGLKRRDDDFTRAMNDLVTEGKVYALTDDGSRVNFGAPMAASSMSREDLDKYKIALQIGSKMTLGQMERVSDKTKELARDNRALQAKIREDTRKFKENEAQRKNETVMNNIVDTEYGMAFRAMYEMGKDVELAPGYVPYGANARGIAISKLSELIKQQEAFNADADAAGVTDLDKRKRDFRAYDKDSIDAAKRILHEWSTWKETMSEYGKEVKAEGRREMLSGVDIGSRFLKDYADLDDNGLPAHLYSDNSYLSKIRAYLSGWDRDAKKGNMSAAEMDSKTKDVLKAAGVSDVDGYMKALNSVDSNMGLRDRIRDLVRSEAGPGHHAYDYATLHNHEMATRATAKFNSLQNLVSKYNMDGKSRDGDEVFQAYMRRLQDQKDGLVQACMSYAKPDASTGWTGEVYDKERYNEFMKNCQALIDATANGYKVSGEFRKDIDGTYFAQRIANKERDDILKTIADSEADPEFYDGRSADRIFDAVASSDTATLFNDRELLESIESLDDYEGTTPIAHLASTQYLGALKLVTRMDPLNISTKGLTSKGMSNLNKSLRIQKRMYDEYIAKRNSEGVTDFSKDPLALTMETCMDYTAKKMAIATLRRDGDMTPVEARCLDRFEEQYDEDMYGKMMNLDYDSAWGFTNFMYRDSQSEVDARMSNIDGILDETTYENSLLTHMNEVKDSAIATAGLTRTLDSIAMAVDGLTADSDVAKFFEGDSNRADRGMTIKSMRSFFGYSDTSRASRATIYNDYGFNYDNVMDHMAVMALREVGVETFSSLKTFTPEHLDSIAKRLEATRTRLYEDEGLSQSSKVLADKACISALNTVSCFKGYSQVKRRIQDSGSLWVTKDGQSMTSDLLADMDTNFDGVFRIAKSKLWTSNLSNTFDSITPLNKENIDAMAVTSVICSAAGVDPSLGQGHVNDAWAKKMKESIANMFLERTANNVAVESFVSADRAMTGDSALLAFTASGGLGAYGSGKVATMSKQNILNQVTMPLPMYRLISDIIGGPKKGEADSAILDEESEFNMNPAKWNEQYADITGKTLDAQDVSLIAVKNVDPDTKKVTYSKFYAPIIKGAGGTYRLVRTWDPASLGGVTESDILDRFGGKIKDIVDKEGINDPKFAPGLESKLYPGKAESHKAASAGGRGPWSGESIAKADDVNTSSYLHSSAKALYEVYGASVAGGRVINNILYPYGVKGNAVVCLVNRTNDAVVCNTGSKEVVYVSRRFGEIRCGEYSQTLGGVKVNVTLPWEDIKISPPCPFYGLLDVYVPWAKDGFKDPRVIEEAKKTVCTFVEAAKATAMIRDFGGFDDTPTIEADPIARSIRNVLMRAYVKVGAYSMSVFDALHAKSDSLPKVTLNSYSDVLRSAYFLAREVGIGPCDSHGAWHLIKGIRSNIILAIDANPFMQYRRAYASSRPEVDAIAYIGTGMDAARKEQDVKDLFMLIGAMAACERPPLPDFVPGFYDDSRSEWEDAVDYWYVMLHHPDAPRPEPESEPEPEAEPTDEEGGDESGMDEESS